MISSGEGISPNHWNIWELKMVKFIATAADLIAIVETAKAVELAKYAELQDRIMVAFETEDNTKGKFSRPSV